MSAPAFPLPHFGSCRAPLVCPARSSRVSRACACAGFCARVPTSRVVMRQSRSRIVSFAEVYASLSVILCLVAAVRCMSLSCPPCRVAPRAA
eukprot:scaffold20054_cov125-Isochrysis_galbana.AAC.2